MSRIHNLFYWLGQADEAKVAQIADKIAGNTGDVIDSQGVKRTIGLAEWPVYRRRRRGCKYWPRGIAELD
jgi:hypothetical protein